MTEMIVFGFKFKQGYYRAIANIWKKSTNGLYRITVMNGDLERLLFGNNIFSRKDGRFLWNEINEDAELRQLQQALTLALNNHYLPG